jgi:hypothetical protein
MRISTSLTVGEMLLLHFVTIHTAQQGRMYITPFSDVTYQMHSVGHRIHELPIKGCPLSRYDEHFNLRLLEMREGP